MHGSALKRPGVFVLPPGWDASLLQGYTPVLNSQYPFIQLAPVVQRVDNATHQINRYPVDKC